MQQSAMVITACIAVSGCATSYRMERLAAYQALPLPAEQFAELDAYAAVFVPHPPKLYATEEGSAWFLLVRNGSASPIATVAVGYQGASRAQACSTHVGELIAILPGAPERFVGAQGLLVAHDGARCFGAGGVAIACARTDAWKHAMPLTVHAVTARGTPPDDAIRTWYATMLRHPMVQARNMTLAEDAYDTIGWETSVWNDLVDALPLPIGAGVAAGILSGPVSGVVVGGIAYLIRSAMVVIAPEGGPEYGDTPMTADRVAKLMDYFLTCTAPVTAVSAAPSE